MPQDRGGFIARPAGVEHRFYPILGLTLADRDEQVKMIGCMSHGAARPSFWDYTEHNLLHVWQRALTSRVRLRDHKVEDQIRATYWWQREQGLVDEAEATKELAHKLSIHLVVVRIGRSPATCAAYVTPRRAVSHTSQHATSCTCPMAVCHTTPSYAPLANTPGGQPSHRLPSPGFPL